MRLIVALSVLFLAYTARAGNIDIPLNTFSGLTYWSNQVDWATTPTTTSTMTAVVTNDIRNAYYHEFLLTSVSTNNSSIAIDTSLDQVNWNVNSTNNITQTNFAYVAISGRWIYYRLRCIGTNTVLTFIYVGGR